MVTALPIFVSHSHEDNAFCHALVTELRNVGADVWYDEHNMGPGQLGPTIEREVRERPVFVVILSPAALHSPWVEDETRWAYGLWRKDTSHLIQPVTAATLREDDIWLFLRDFKRIEAPGFQPFPLEEAVRRTLRTLGLTPVGEKPAPPPPQPMESAEELVARGNALNDQGKHAEALPLFERATLLAPQSFDAWGSLGGALGALERWPESLTATERAVTLNPNNASVWNNKAGALFKLTFYDEALVAYDWALHFDPYNAIFWNNKANALLHLERYREALKALDRALVVDPTYSFAWCNKGNALMNLKRSREALAAYDRALALSPYNAIFWNNKGEALNGLQRYDEALLCLNRALALDQNLADVWKNRATVLRCLGRVNEANEAEAGAKALGA